MHRRRAADYSGYGDAKDLGEEGRSRGVQGLRMLTLGALAWTARSEGDGRRRISPLRRRPEAVEMRTATAIQNTPSRFHAREEAAR